MFIGHFGAAFAATRVAPAASLGTFVLAAQLADLIWPVLVLLGVETVEVRPGDTAFTPLAFTSYPYSHSLLALVGWAAVAAAAYRTARPDHPRRTAVASLTVGGLVLSHWVLDWITHRPDLPLTPGGAGRYGLGLWNSVPATLVIETALFAAGVWLYQRVAGSLPWRTWALIVFLLVVYAANLVGPAPPSSTAVAWAGLAIWLLVAWAYWADHARVAASERVL